MLSSSAQINSAWDGTPEGLKTILGKIEFAHSMTTRDLEQLYLALQGAGSGSPGDGGTQDQQVGVTQETGDGGGLPDLSGLATIDYVNQLANQLLSSISSSSSSWSGGSTSALLTSGSSWSKPSGVNRVLAFCIGGGGGNNGAAVIGYISSNSSVFSSLTFSATGTGASGGGILAFLDVSSISSLTYSIGSGGTPGNNGGDTTLTGTNISLTATGGLAGNGGWAGSGSSSGSATGTSVLWSLPLQSTAGLSFAYTSVSPTSSNSISSGNAGKPPINIGYGHGSLGTTSGTQGAILLIY